MALVKKIFLGLLKCLYVNRKIDNSSVRYTTEEMTQLAKKAADQEVKRHLENGRPVYGRKRGAPFWIFPKK